VLIGPNGLLSGLARGTVVAIHATVRPSTITSLAKIAVEHSISVFDAAVSRSPGPKAFQVTCMVGGDNHVIEKARPLIDAYSCKVIHAGALGAGMSLKLANNLVTYIQLLAAVEGYRLAKASGLDIALLTDLMKSNGNMTPSMAANCGPHGLRHRRVPQGSDRPRGSRQEGSRACFGERKRIRRCFADHAGGARTVPPSHHQ
jgi:3-hydroxyisobutyrate dehydrogenase-like beta-hydroxyacid dehydrogenase